jgi:hypothetical protein
MTISITISAFRVHLAIETSFKTNNYMCKLLLRYCGADRICKKDQSRYLFAKKNSFSEEKIK